jgi:serine phosphatase RsbU (regulator of sigma subunit)
MEQDVVREIQSRFDAPQYRGRLGTQVAVRRVPGAGLGGDFHNVCHGGEGRSLIVVGTVLGGGMMAAFAKAVLAGEAAQAGSAPAAPERLWHCLCSTLDRINADARHRIRCAAFHGSFDRSLGRFEYRTAGRIIPIAIGPRQDATLLSSDVPAMGNWKSAAAPALVLDLKRVSRLVVLTEGLASAESPDGRRMLDATGLQLVSKTGRLDPEEQADVLIRRLREHVGPNHVFTEDATVFIVDLSAPACEHGAGMAELLKRSRAAAFDEAADSSIFIG